MISAERARKMARVAWHQLERAAAWLDRASRRAALHWAASGSLEREADHWSSGKAPAILTWQDHPVIRRYINRRVSGDPETNWLAWFAREFGRPAFGRALNLGCGFGDLEAHALALGFVREFDSFDVSPAALDAARARLRGRPVNFELCDVNQMELPPEKYDAVFAGSSLHHFTELPRVLDQIVRGLLPGGWLVFDEYVGPSRFQWRDSQLRLVNEVLAALPHRYRRDLRGGLRRKKRVYRPPLDESNRDSPFEAIRSEEILPLVQARFQVQARRDYGGGLLHPLLDGLAGNFRMDRDEDVQLLTRLAALEQELERASLIAADFTVVAARKG